MTTSDASSHAQLGIKTAVRSAATCSGKTVQSLSHLLCSNVNAPPTNISASRQRGPKKPASSTLPKKKTAKNVDIYEDQDQYEGLSARERATLATDVVNGALQTLGEIVRNQNASSSTGSIPEDTRSMQHPRGRSRAGGVKSSKPMRRVQEISSNPVSSSLQAPKSRHTTQLGRGDGESKPCEGTEAIVECARTAFEHLRVITPTDCGTEPPEDWLVEHGMIAFIGKLVSLRFANIAARELKSLKRRLELRMGHFANKSIPSNLGQDVKQSSLETTKRETLATLLRFECADLSDPVVHLIISYQILVLRTMSISGRPQAVEAVKEYIDPEDSSSPINLIQRYAAWASDSDRAALLMEQLSQVLLSLCPKLLTSADCEATDFSKHVKPETCLRLQTLALFARRRWMTLAGHCGNSDVDILKQYRKCLATCVRRSTTSNESTYWAAKSGFELLSPPRKETCDNNELASEMKNLYNQFSHLAEQSGLHSEGQQWLKLLNSGEAKSKASPVEQWTLACRIATIELNYATKHDGPSQLEPLRQALLHLTTTRLIGTAEEITRMICAGFELRKAASNFTKVKSVASRATKNSDHSDAQTVCHGIINACISLQLKIFKATPGTDYQCGDSEAQHRRQLISKGARSSIESVIYTHSQIDDYDEETLKSSKSVLQLSLQLLHAIEDNLPNDSGVQPVRDPRTSSLHILLSNAFFRLYVKSKDSFPNQSLSILQVSCDVLIPRERSEKRDGNLCIKLEKLARGLHNHDQERAYRDAYLALVETWCDMRILENCSATGDFRSLPSNWKEDAQSEVIADALRVLLESEARNPLGLPHGRLFFDHEGLETEDRGAILEWQLILTSEARISKALSSYAFKMTPALTIALYEFYRGENYRVRRLRVSLRILNLAADIPDRIPASVLKVAEDCLTSGSREEFICPEYDGEVPAFLRLCIASVLLMRGVSKNAIYLESCLSECFKLVNSSNSWPEVASVVGETDLFLERLTSLSFFLGSNGNPYLQLSAARLKYKLYELRLQISTEGFVKASVDLSLQLLRLGYSELAGFYLSKARDRICDSQFAAEECLEYHLAYAEYFLDLEDWSQCREHLDNAESLSENISASLDAGRASQRYSKIFEIARNMDLLQLQSRLHLCTGSFTIAFWFAKREVTILQSVWKSLEAREVLPQRSCNQSESDSPDLINAFTRLQLSNHDQSISESKPSPVYGASFWPLAPRLLRALVHLSELYQYGGLLNDSTYNLDQALLLTQNVTWNHAIAAVLVRKGDYAGRAGNTEASWDCFERANKVYHDSTQVKDVAALHQAIGYFHRMRQQWSPELDAYDLGESILAKLVQPSFVRHIEGSPNKMNASHSAKAPIKSSTVSSNRRRAAQSGPVHPKGKFELEGNSLQQCESASPPLSAEQYALFDKFQKDLVRLKAESLLLQGDLDASAKLISRFDTDSRRFGSVVEEKICQCRQLVHEATKALSTDGIFAMIAESALSFPGAAVSTKRLGDEPAADQKHLIHNKKIQKHTNSRTKVSPQSSTVDKFRQLLDQALRGLSMKRIATEQICALSVLRQAAAVVGTASVMLSSVELASADLPLHPLQLAYSTDLPQSIASLRDRAVSHVEKTQKQSRQQLSLRDELAAAQHLSSAETSELKHELIDSLPACWTAISISLDESRHHLHLTRYRAKQSPFVLRLPLTRQNAEDVDEESFTFAEAKSEISKIVELSDLTVHAARDSAEGMKNRSAKTQWWAEREALDSRLHDFLLNIENMWLGGFRGVFSQHRLNPHLLARFQQTFDGILDKHLPSRQKSRKRATGPNIKLDPQVLDIFVGLTKSLEEIDELDEALTDLLYFVVDIFQFNGETNAYDEIDFDSIIIETQDALRSYCEAVQLEKNAYSAQHTILVLDKQLHCFPWESLPCLDGASVSRVYSLVELQERIMLSQNQTDDDQGVIGIYASSTNGTSILNPSGDLKKTQGRFENALSPFSQAPYTWNTITNRVPTEDEFAAALCKSQDEHGNNGILLYFGHGSGAQYIRHRRIKQLRFQHGNFSPSNSDQTIDSLHAMKKETISTTLLFGCSSASLRENLEFEPHGTPKSYMLAGAPALLGSLWDVTDGDVDKFAGGVLERWGLLQSGTFAELRKEGVKAKSRNGVGRHKLASQRTHNYEAAEEICEGLEHPMSLTEAVSQSRGDCYLKYLNGAAMVVYGVPVYLDKK